MFRGLAEPAYSKNSRENKMLWKESAGKLALSFFSPGAQINVLWRSTGTDGIHLCSSGLNMLLKEKPHCLMNTSACDTERGPYPALGRVIAGNEVQNATHTAGRDL